MLEGVMGGAWRRTRVIRRAGVVVLTCVTLLLLGNAVFAQAAAPPDRERLTPRQLETPGFDRPSRVYSGSRALENVWSDLIGPTGVDFLRRLLPTQAGVLWIALVVALVVAFDFTRPLSARNVELLALLVTGFLLFDVMRFFDLLRDPTYFRVLDWVFTAIVAVGLFLIGRALWRMRRPLVDPWQPNLPARALITLTLLLLTCNLLIGVLRPPDDAGFYSNLGAQRLRERRMFPYGDPLLSGTPGATYSPVFYVAHLPFQIMLDPQPVNPDAPDRPDLTSQPYYLPPVLATQLTTVSFHLIGVTALIVAARKLAGSQAAWGLAALYCGSAYVMGVGGDREMIGGITFISHIAAPSVMLLAFAALSRPSAAGALLATGVATLFYPVFFIPAWLGYYWRNRAAAIRFVGGMVLATLVIGVPVLLRSQPADGRSLIGTILHDTQGHQQDPAAYGSSPFGFWGLRGGVRALFREPLVPGQFNTSPMFLIFAVFAGGAFFLARGRTPVQLALLTGALAIGAQMWKIHGTGVYVTWYYPFLLLGFFLSSERSGEAGEASAGAPERLPRWRGSPVDPGGPEAPPSGDPAFR